LTVAAPPRRRTWYSTAELAQRWRMNETQVRLLLEPLVATGYVVRRGEGWRASTRAVALHLEGDPV